MQHQVILVPDDYYIYEEQKGSHSKNDTLLEKMNNTLRK